MTFIEELLVILGLTLLNGVFAGAEIAMLAVRKTRLRELVEQGRRSASVALALRQDTERLLATIQIGISVIGAATAVFGGTRLQQPLTRWLAALGAPYADEIAFAIVVAFIAYLSLVLGELVPKSLALQRSERFALLVARGIFALSKLARPVVWLLTQSSNLVLLPLRDRTTFAESRLSIDELRQLLEESAASGGELGRDVSEIAVRTLDFGELAVHAVMIPRTRIVSLPQRAPREVLLDTLRAQRFARYPVTVENDEDIAGYVLARELLDRLARYPGEREVDVLALARELPTFREQAPAVEALRRLQRCRAPLGLVIDEHGSVAGLLTVEDLAEEVLGEILEEDEVTTPLLQRESDHSFLVRGDAPLQELGRELDIDLEPRPGATTMAGLVTHVAGKIPKVGERVEVHPLLEAEVLDANPRVVRAVRLRRLGRQPAGA